MAKVLIIGCGDLGSAIANHLKHEHQVTGLRRTIHAAAGGMQTITANVTQPNTLIQLNNLQPNIVIYCVSADAQTDESYQAQYITGLQNIVNTQNDNAALQAVFFISSTRVYGQKTDTLLDENTPAIPTDFGGERLLEAENWLKLTAQKQAEQNNMPWKPISMRLSGIYGNGRLYLANMAKDVAKWPVDNNWSNRIHRDDAAGFIAFMVNKVLQRQPIEDCYIVTDDMPTQQYEVLKWLAQQQAVDTGHIKTPPVSGGKRLSNNRLQSTGFQLQYPSYQFGYSQILGMTK